MIRRHYSTIDNKTGKELILSQCSYNLAMDWLQRTLNKEGMCINETVKYDNCACMTAVSIIDGSSGRIFYYDGERGYLLGE